MKGNLSQDQGGSRHGEKWMEVENVTLADRTADATISLRFGKNRSQSGLVGNIINWSSFIIFMLNLRCFETTKGDMQGHYMPWYLKERPGLKR